MFAVAGVVLAGAVLGGTAFTGALAVDTVFAGVLAVDAVVVEDGLVVAVDEGADEPVSVGMAHVGS